MRRFMLAGAVALNLVAGVAATPAFAATDDAAFIAACRNGDGASEKTCTCLAGVAARTLDERMRGYVLLSMAHPDQFAAKAQAKALPGIDYGKWNHFLQEGTRACGYGG